MVASPAVEPIIEYLDIDVIVMRSVTCELIILHCSKSSNAGLQPAGEYLSAGNLHAPKVVGVPFPNASLWN